MTLGAWCWREGGWLQALMLCSCLSLVLWCLWFMATGPEQSWVAVLLSLGTSSDLWKEVPE